MKQQAIVYDMSLGELSPRFRGRFDLPAYARGATEMTNAFPLLQGGFTYRPGTAHLGFTKEITGVPANVRLLPLQISTTENYVLEFGYHYIRIWDHGALVLQSPGVPLELVTSYSLSEITEIQYDQADRIMVLCHDQHPVRVVSKLSNTWKIGNLGIVTTNGDDLPFNAAGDYPSSCAFFEGRLWLSGTSNKGGGIWASRVYKYADEVAGELVADFTEFQTIIYTSKGITPPTSDFIGTLVSGSTTISGIAESAIKELSVGNLITGVGIPTGPLVADKTFVQSLGETSLVLDKAATASRTGTIDRAWPDQFSPVWKDVTSERDFTSPDHAISLEVEDRVIWMVADKDLIVGCLRGERVIPSGSFPPVVQCRRQTAIGSAKLKPFKITGSVVFTESSRKAVREYEYDNVKESYQAPSLSFSAEHILADGIAEMDFQSTPTPVIWLVTEAGEMIGVVYSKTNGVAAWFRVHTQGVIESVAVIPGDHNDEVYLSVLRDGKRRVERLIAAGEGHLDASRQATASTRAVSGLSWLDGPACVVYGDLAYTVNVVAGAFLLPNLVPDNATVSVGYRQTMLVSTMPLTAQAQIGTAHMRPKTIHQIIARVLQSHSFKTGTVLTQMEEAPISGSASGDYQIPISGQWDTEGVIHFMQEDPFDVTILAVQVEVDAGG
jgi:hypothetical protein